MRKKTIIPHHCPEWDFLFIFPHDPEWECCICEPFIEETDDNNEVELYEKEHFKSSK